MQEDAEACACAHPGAILYGALPFQCGLYLSLGYSIHLWAVGFRWTPRIWKLKVAFDPAVAKFF